MAAMKEAKLVIVDWNDLIAGKPIHASIEEAYGPNGTGIIGIRNVPEFVENKDAVLRFSHALASLPSDYLENALTDAKVRDYEMFELIASNRVLLSHDRLYITQVGVMERRRWAISQIRPRHPSTLIQ